MLFDTEDKYRISKLSYSIEYIMNQRLVICIIIALLTFYIIYICLIKSKPFKTEFNQSIKSTNVKNEDADKSKKNSIAIISSVFNHIECLGFLLEYLNMYNIDIYINKDIYKHIDYFKTKYKFNLYNINNFDENNCDKIIKLTASDPYVVYKKHISILHLVGKHLPVEVENVIFITLSPFVKPIDYKYIYLLSVYNDYIDDVNLNKNIGFIGMFGENEKKILSFIENINGKLICLGCNLKNSNNIDNYNNIKTLDLVEKLKNCSYIYIR
tara:strand:+ start:326 stop:1132 length:807 start_codon:yes stop_codon:yes gene_type:complete